MHLGLKKTLPNTSLSAFINSHISHYQPQTSSIGEDIISIGHELSVFQKAQVTEFSYMVGQ